MKKIKLLVVDDHPVLRKGLVALLEKADSIDVICEAENGQEAIDCIEEEKPDVVLMDINMEGKLDVTTTETIKERWPHIKVLAFSMHQEVQVIKRMIRAGASGYVLKNAPHQEVLHAIETVMNGGSYFGQEVLDIMTQAITEEGEDDHEIVLSNREKEVLHFVAKEYTNQEIAEKINISLRTVETHKRNLIKKLRVKNVVGLVRFALEQGHLLDIR